MNKAVFTAQCCLYLALFVPGLSTAVLGLFWEEIYWWGWVLAIFGAFCCLVGCELFKAIANLWPEYVHFAFTFDFGTGTSTSSHRRRPSSPPLRPKPSPRTTRNPKGPCLYLALFVPGSVFVSLFPFFPTPYSSLVSSHPPHLFLSFPSSCHKSVLHVTRPSRTRSFSSVIQTISFLQPHDPA